MKYALTVAIAAVVLAGCATNAKMTPDGKVTEAPGTAPPPRYVPPAAPSTGGSTASGNTLGYAPGAPNTIPGNPSVYTPSTLMPGYGPGVPGGQVYHEYNKPEDTGFRGDPFQAHGS